MMSIKASFTVGTQTKLPFTPACCQSVRRTLHAHDTGPIRTGQDTLREGVVEGTRRDNYTAHHTACTLYKHCYTPRKRLP